MTKPIVATLALASISAFAFFSILVLFERNGSGALIRDSIQQPGSPLPGGDGLAGRTEFTGLPVVDQILTSFVRVFYPAVRGEVPSLSLFSAYFLGQVVPIYGAIFLESLRTGSKWTPFWFVTAWGQLCQMIPFGAIMPIYFAINLWRSPLARLNSYTTASSRVELLSADPTQVVMVAPAVLLGLVVPSILMCLPAPQFFTLDNQQILIALWQIFPVWVGLWHYDLVFLVGSFDPVPASVNRDPSTRLRHAAWTYRALLLLGAAAHVALVAAALSPQAVLPDVFGLADADFAAVTLRSVFAPTSPFDPVPVGSVAEGTLTLLQWDLYCSAAAGLVWVASLSYRNSGRGLTAAAGTAGKSLARSVLVGPLGAVVWALWDRDADALEEAAIEGKKNE